MKEDFHKKFTLDILMEMPESKKEQFRKTLERNYILTSSYILEHGEIIVYKEGWYIQLFGTRCKFSVWATDNDGDFVFERKPVEKKLHKIHSVSLRFSESDYKNI